MIMAYDRIQPLYRRKIYSKKLLQMKKVCILLSRGTNQKEGIDWITKRRSRMQTSDSW